MHTQTVWLFLVQFIYMKIGVVKASKIAHQLFFKNRLMIFKKMIEEVSFLD